MPQSIGILWPTNWRNALVSASGGPISENSILAGTPDRAPTSVRYECADPPLNAIFTTESDSVHYSSSIPVHWWRSGFGIRTDFRFQFADEWVVVRLDEGDLSQALVPQESLADLLCQLITSPSIAGVATPGQRIEFYVHGCGEKFPIEPFMWKQDFNVPMQENHIVKAAGYPDLATNANIPMASNGSTARLVYNRVLWNDCCPLGGFVRMFCLIGEKIVPGVVCRWKYELGGPHGIQHPNEDEPNGSQSAIIMETDIIVENEGRFSPVFKSVSNIFGVATWEWRPRIGVNPYQAFQATSFGFYSFITVEIILEIDRYIDPDPPYPLMGGILKMVLEGNEITIGRCFVPGRMGMGFYFDQEISHEESFVIANLYDNPLVFVNEECEYFTYAFNEPTIRQIHATIEYPT